jgi:hypothetical protein
MKGMMKTQEERVMLLATSIVWNNLFTKLVRNFVPKSHDQP